MEANKRFRNRNGTQLGTVFKGVRGDIMQNLIIRELQFSCAQVRILADVFGGHQRNNAFFRHILVSIADLIRFGKTHQCAQAVFALQKQFVHGTLDFLVRRVAVFAAVPQHIP